MSESRGSGSPSGRAAAAACALWIGVGATLFGAASCAGGSPAEREAAANAGEAGSAEVRERTPSASRSGARGEPRRRAVEKSRLRFDDGDTLDIAWEAGTRETVRILGIDTPEVAHPEHKLPVAQPYGERAAGFLEGCLARSERVELLDRGQKDPYGRTLGYLLLDGRNYSVLVLEAGLAAESVSHYGDNGFPAEAAACLEAAKKAGALPFEAPHEWRKRFRVFVDQKAERERATAR